jgi:hypothetical protein
VIANQRNAVANYDCLNGIRLVVLIFTRATQLQ